MSIYVNDRYRIKRNQSQEKSMRLLTESGVLKSYANVLALSAVIGYRNKAYIEIDVPASDGVLMQFFSEEEKDLIDMIAYAHKKVQNILKSDEKYEIFESYANGGFPILVDKLGVNIEGMDLANLITKQNELVTQIYSILITDDVELDTKSSLENLI